MPAPGDQSRRGIEVEGRCRVPQDLDKPEEEPEKGLGPWGWGLKPETQLADLTKTAQEHDLPAPPANLESLEYKRTPSGDIAVEVFLVPLSKLRLTYLSEGKEVRVGEDIPIRSHEFIADSDDFNWWMVKSVHINLAYADSEEVYAEVFCFVEKSD